MSICISPECSIRPTPGTIDSAEPRCRKHYASAHKARKRQDARTASSLAPTPCDASPAASPPLRPAQPRRQPSKTVLAASTTVPTSTDSPADLPEVLKPDKPFDATAAIAAWAIANATPSTAPGRIPAVEPEKPARWSPWS